MSFLLLVLICIASCTGQNGPYRGSSSGPNRGKSHPSEGYNYPKNGNPYDHGYKNDLQPAKPKEVSKDARCSKEPTWLTVEVVKQSCGHRIKEAIVYIVDSTKMKYAAITEHQHNGLAKFEVTGCCVGLNVYVKGGQPVFKEVDLSSSTSKEETVVVTTTPKCSFTVEFIQAEASMGEGKTATVDSPYVNIGADNSLTYMYSSGASTGYGVAGAGPLCITGEPGDKLKLLVSSQYGNVFNALDIKIPEKSEHSVALVSLPPQTMFNFGLTGCVNMWYFEVDAGGIYGPAGTVHMLKPVEVEEFCLIDHNGNALTDLWSDKHCFAAKKDDTRSNDYIIIIKPKILQRQQMMASDARAAIDSDPVSLKGNLAVMDCSGDISTQQIGDLTNVKEYKGNYYYFVPVVDGTSYTWDEVEGLCMDWIGGGHLASIHSQDELDFIKGNVLGTGTLLGGRLKTGVVGSSDINVWKENLVWSDGTKNDFPGLFNQTKNWFIGSPSGDTGEDKLTWAAPGHVTPGLNDIASSNGQTGSFVCKTKCPQSISPPIATGEYWVAGCVCGSSAKHYKPINKYILEAAKDELTATGGGDKVKELCNCASSSSTY